MNTGVEETLIAQRARLLEPSRIREVAELGMGQAEVLPLWFGESAWPTDEAIVDTAVRALQAGNHKYQPNNGAACLREEICSYSNRLFQTNLAIDRITVTPSGMQGLMLSAELLIDKGDRVVALEPGWPNIAGAFKAMGAEITTVTLRPDKGRWKLELNALLAAITRDVKVVIINSPNNPTGWTMTAEDQAVVLDHCRKLGIWIVADDVYSRLYRHGKFAPSFLSIADPDDRLISVNSFSKCWSMTGWRLGWMVAPAAFEAKLGQLTEFNTSCTPGFVQEAGITALRQGEAQVTDLCAKIQAGYEIADEMLSRQESVEFIEPDGAFYCFFRVAGLTESAAAAKRILAQTKVGLAPGIAFGSAGEGYLRLCYAQPTDVLFDAFERLAPFLSKPRD